MQLSKNHLLKPLLKLSAPIILANTLQSAYQLIDTFWVGRLGAGAVASVSLSFPLLFLILAMGLGLTLAGTVLVAQYKGMNDQKMVDMAASQTLSIMTIVSVVLAGSGVLLAEPLMQIIGTPDNIFADTVSYFRISSFGFVFLFIFFVSQSLLRGVGRPNVPMVIVSITVALNLFLDPLFIFGWGPIPAMGVSGAAVASVITQGLSALVGVYVLLDGKYGIKISRKCLIPEFKWVRMLVKIGLPASVEQSTRAMSMGVMIILVTAFGSEMVASYGIGARILGFIVIPALGFAIATTTLVGQYIGAGSVGKAEQAGMISIKVSFYSLTVVGIILFLLAEPITALFVPGEPEVIRQGALFIKIMAPSFGLLAMQQVINGIFNGAGKTAISMIISIISLWMMRFPIAFVLSHNTSLGVEGIFWSFPISNLLAAIMAFIWFRTGRWKPEGVVRVLG